MTPLLRRLVVAVFMLGVTFVIGCTRSAPDSTPDGAVRLWLERMESGEGDSHAMRDAYQLLGPHARANLKDRAERASRGQGRRLEPHEMLAEGRFGLRFRPTAFRSQIAGDDATVEVRGEGEGERATVRCTREGSAWRVEPELPDVVAPARRNDGGT